MKKIYCVLSAALALAMVSCGGSGSANTATISLDELDDNYTVKSYTIETDAKEKSVEQIGKIKGTLTIVVERDKGELKYKPSDVEWAYLEGESSATPYYLFKEDCTAVVKKILKMEPGKKETFTIGFSAWDPYMSYKSDEENAEIRQVTYDALTTGGINQISISIDFKEELAEVLQSLGGAVKDMADEMDDDE